MPKVPIQLDILYSPGRRERSKVEQLGSTLRSKALLPPTWFWLIGGTHLGSSCNSKYSGFYQWVQNCQSVRPPCLDAGVITFLPFLHLSTFNIQAICWIAIFSGSRIMCWRSWQGWTWQPPPAQCFFRTLRSPAWSTSPPSRVWDRCSSTRTTSPS